MARQREILSKYEKLDAQVTQVEANLEGPCAAIALEIVRLTPERRRSVIDESMKALEAGHRSLVGLSRRFRLVEKGDSKAATAGPDLRSRRIAAQIEKRFKGVRHRSVHWPKLRDLIETQFNPEREPIQREVVRETGLQYQYRMISERVSRWHQEGAGPDVQDLSARDHSCHPDIPINLWDFTYLMGAAYRLCLAQKRPRPWSFLDVGCGGGTKVQVASQYFETAVGLEYDPGYAATARNLFARLGPDHCSVIEGDGITFPDYDAFDVIYCYWPVSSVPMMAAMERQIISTSRKGTIVLMPYQYFMQRCDEYDCKWIAEFVYVKGISNAEARELRTEAERMGRDVVAPHSGRNPLTGFWDPIIAACETNGHLIRSGITREIKFDVSPSVI